MPARLLACYGVLYVIAAESALVHLHRGSHWWAMFAGALAVFCVIELRRAAWPLCDRFEAMVDHLGEDDGPPGPT